MATYTGIFNDSLFITGLVSGLAIAVALVILCRMCFGSNHKKHTGLPFEHVETRDPKAPQFTIFKHDRIPTSESIQRAHAFSALLDSRRSIRHFKSDPVPAEVLEECVRAAGTAPSGAHRQPWTFSVITDPAVKAKMREIVEEEEQKNWHGRMKESWKEDLRYTIASLHQDNNVAKPYLTEAPALVCVWEQKHSYDKEGKKLDHYYVRISAAIAAGIFLSALHNANLCSLTSTPDGASKKLAKLLGRPDTERILLLMPVGYPADDARIPYRTPEERRKTLSEIMTRH